MAEIFVRNSLNSTKAVKFNLSLKETLSSKSEGESLWVIEVGTRTPKADGTAVPPVYINNVSEKTLEAEINKAISSMCSLLDWAVLEADNEAPELTYFSPEGTLVPISSVIEFKLKENLPASGIDLSSMVVTLNNGTVDFDITSELKITGDPFDYTLKWIPPNQG